MEQETFHLIKPKPYDTEDKKKVNLLSRPWLRAEREHHNLGWHHHLDTNITGKKIKPAPIHH